MILYFHRRPFLSHSCTFTVCASLTRVFWKWPAVSGLRSCQCYWALSATAIWPACSSHCHLCHIITSGYFRNFWAVNNKRFADAKERGRDRESQRVSPLTHGRLRAGRSAVASCFISVDPLFVLYMPYSVYSCAPCIIEGMLGTNLSVVWAVHWKDILTSIFNIALRQDLLEILSVFTALEKCLLCWGPKRCCRTLLLLKQPHQSVFAHKQTCISRPRGILVLIVLLQYSACYSMNQSSLPQSVNFSVIALCVVWIQAVFSHDSKRSLIFQRVSEVLMQRSGENPRIQTILCDVASPRRDGGS